MVINPEVKDKILNYLILHAKVEQFQSGDTNENLKELDIDFDTFHAVMTYFERVGFLKELGLNRRGVHFILLIEAHDFYLRGGYSVQEEILETNVKKLLFEIDNLKKQLEPDKLDKLNKISSIASAIFSGLALLPK